MTLALFAFASISTTYAHENDVPISVKKAAIPITGTLTDDKGEPIVGAAIQVKGTSLGTISDENGKFSIQVPNEKAILIVSFVGFEKQEIAVGNRTVVDIKLSQIGVLDEVVVVGYGTQKKVNMTGAVSSVDAQAIENRPVSNAANALQGLSPGLMITRQGGHQVQKVLVSKFGVQRLQMVVLTR